MRRQPAGWPGSSGVRGIALVCSVLSLALIALEPKGKRLSAPVLSLLRGADSEADGAKRATLADSYRKLSLSFEANVGQTHPQVKFLARGPGYTLFLTSDGAVLSLRRQELGVQSQLSAARDTNSEAGRRKSGTRNWEFETGNLMQVTRNPQIFELLPGISTRSSLLPRLTTNNPQTRNPLVGSIINCQSTTANFQVPTSASQVPTVIRLKLVGANPYPRVVGLDPLLGKSNYFLGNNPKRWHTNVANYTKVRYENVYPGIDVVYHGREPEVSGQQPEAGSTEAGRAHSPRMSGSQLEWDFVVAPGADPAAIVFEVEAGNGKRESGNSKAANGDAESEAGRASFASRESRIPSPDGVRIDANGDLAIATAAGELRLRKPVAYQPMANLQSRGVKPGIFKVPSFAAPRQLLEAHYTLRPPNPKSKIANPKWEVGFEVASYDPGKPLIIDPVLSYSTYLGGAGFDYASGIAVDSVGRAYVVGYTDSVDFPLTSPTQAALGGGTCGTSSDASACFDAFIAKLNPSGTALIYSAYFGGNGEDYATKIAIDSVGNAYLTGYTNSTDLPVVNAAQSVQGGGLCGVSPCFDAFVTKLNTTGTALVYSTYLGGSADDYGQGIAVDSAGSAVVTGFTASTDFPTAAALQSVHGGGLYDAVVTKLAPTGSALAYSTYLGGSGDDRGSDIAVDASGNAYLTGSTNSTDFPTADPLQAASGGGTCGPASSPSACFDGYVAKLNADGSSLVYSTYFGGSAGDYGYGIAVDASGSAYVTGLTTSINFPVTPGAFQLTGGGTSVDAFVAKLDAAGSSAVYATYLGGNGTEAGLDIAVDSAGSAYIAGYAYGSGLPLASPSQATNGGYYDAFLAKLNATGSALVFSTYLGGSGNEKARGVAVDPAGDAYLAGDTFSTDFPISSGAFQTSYGSGAFDAFVAKFTNLALPVLRLSEAKVTFSGQGVGTPSPAHTVTLTNSGDAELALGGITASGDFTQTNDCPAAVAPASTCTLSIVFTPAELGPRSGTIAVASNAYGTPHMLQLEGTGVAAPGVSLSATYLRFADQPLGTTSVPQPVRLTNSGQAPLALSSVTISGNYAQTNNCVSPLAAGAYCTIEVTFAPPPTVAGGQSGTLIITDNAPGSPHTVALGGIGVGPVATLSATSLSFENQPVGTTSAAKHVNLSNTGNASLSVSSLLVSGDFTQTNNCPPTLPARSYCTLRIAFAPTAAGTRTGAITVADSAAGSPHLVNLSGTGTAPAATLSATYLRFADQPLGTTSAPQPVRLTNSGQAPLALSSITISGNYAQTNNCVSPLAAGAYCAIEVSFTPPPTVAGGQSGTLIITDNAPGSPHTVALGGIGVGPVAVLSTTNLNFGTQPVGTTSASRLVNLSNTGNASLSVSSLLVSGDFTQTNNCPPTLPARTYCTVTVTFQPAAVGLRTAALAVLDNAAGSPHMVNLNGTGVSP